MSKTTLIVALQAAVESAPPPHGDPNLATWANISADAVKPLSKALAASEELSGMWGKLTVVPNTSARMEPESAAIYLTDRARATRCGLGDMVDSLLRFAKSGTVTFVSVRSITNVVVHDKVEIGPGIYLAPPESLPSSEARDVAFASGIQFGTAAPPVPPGRSALVAEIECGFFAPAPPPLRPGEVPNPMLLPHDTATPMAIEELFARARLAMTTVGRVSPEFGASYAFVRDLGWPWFDQMGAQGGAILWNQPVQIAKESTPALARLYAKAGSKDPVLGLAVERLHSSRTRHREEERAIDLGSCLEMLLMRDTKPENTEITNKIAHRGAWLLGADGAERREIARVIKATYNLRSSAVHSGVFPRRPLYEDRTILFDHCEILVGRLIDRLLDGWPVWEDVTLGL